MYANIVVLKAVQTVAEDVDVNKMKNRKIIIIEAPDRLGKDTFLKYMKSRDPGEEAYHVYFKDDVKPPDYRKVDEFNTWLKNYLKTEMVNMAGINNNIVIARLFTSDYVYSNLFDRQSYANNVYEFLRLEGFEFYQITFVYKSYEDYKERCIKSGSDVEYDCMEFAELQALYYNSIYNKVIPTTIERTDTIDHEFTYEQIENLIYG